MLFLQRHIFDGAAIGVNFSHNLPPLSVEVDCARGAQEIEQIPALLRVCRADQAAKATARIYFARRPQAEVPDFFD
jgi:hypothetical protein